MDLILLAFALFGHAALWVGFVNRVHATAFPRRVVDTLSWAGLAAVTFLPLGFAVGLARLGYRPPAALPWSAMAPGAVAYLAVCWLVGGGVLALWTWNRVTHRSVDLLWSHRSRLMKLSGGPPGSEEHLHHFLAHLPGNQILQIDVSQRTLHVPRLDPRLDGLRLVHLSDLHFTGRIGKAYFREAFALTNELDTDLVAITGDLVDTNECIDWVPELLGPLKARHGVYYVLGNHDLRIDWARLRRALDAAGLVDLGGRWVRREIHGAPVILAGNELPWFPPAADMQTAPPRTADGGPLRVLLTHSPDQFDWAVAHDFDLALAGHLHGGQYRLPFIGPVLSPSRQGVRFACGIFYREPTILHVSRGLSGKTPVRLNCPPELTEITLRARA